MRKHGSFALPAVLAVAAAIAMAPSGVAAPIQVALVENFTGNSAGVEVMGYVETGQTIRLGPHDTIVLSYLHSCVRETITGGSVTIGVDQSEVKAGEVQRTRLNCDGDKFVGLITRIDLINHIRLNP